MNEIKSIAVVGAGAVGGYYGARLAEAGMEVHFLLRSDYAHVRKHGLRVDSIDGDIRLETVNCADNTGDIGPVDLVIIAWKTTANEHFQEVVGPLLHARSIVLTLQNGLGSVEELARLFGGWRIFGGLCFVCNHRIGPGHLLHRGLGMIHVGEYEHPGDSVSPRLEMLVDLLQRGGVKSRAMPNLEKAQWMKLVWNIPFNGLAIAEGGVDTEVLLATPGMEARIRGIMREVTTVAAALGHDIPDEFIEKQIEMTRPMKAYRPSSMIDFVEGRAVEVDSIWREPLHRAKKLEVDVPEIEQLLREIEGRLRERGN